MHGPGNHTRKNFKKSINFSGMFLIVHENIPVSFKSRLLYLRRNSVIRLSYRIGKDSFCEGRRKWNHYFPVKYGIAGSSRFNCNFIFSMYFFGKKDEFTTRTLEHVCEKKIYYESALNSSNISLMKPLLRTNLFAAVCV